MHHLLVIDKSCLLADVQTQGLPITSLLADVQTQGLLITSLLADVQTQGCR